MNKSEFSGQAIYQVAIASPLRRLFDYLPPAQHTSELAPGTRVTVPFGTRSVTGLVVGKQAETSQPASKLKAITEVLDTAPLLPATLLDLLMWAANYYHSPPGEALNAALPAVLRGGGTLPGQKYWRLTTRGHGLPEGALRRAPRQAALLAMLQQGEISHQSLLDQGFKSTHLRVLADKALIEHYWRVHDDGDNAANSASTRTLAHGSSLLRETPLTLSMDQQRALDAISLNRYQCLLLDGETGSGKTEVYLHAIEKVLSQGRQALVLVPEIGLTPQTLARFASRFNRDIAVLHSGLTDKQRLQNWSTARGGAAAIVIGTRSAVFTPLPNPGIIIVDEEHDLSFKQQEGAFRYSARDVAIMRARRENIPVLLGSATPSLESLYNCEQGRFARLQLTGRHGGARQPGWELVDIRKLRLNTGFSGAAIEAMTSALTSGHQVLVFLNRRGYAPTLLCHDCGWSAVCERCDARLTYHQQGACLRCHHCDYRQGIPVNCEVCHGKQLLHLGQGTQRGESTLEALFPDIPVIRIDRDSTRTKFAMQDYMAEINTGKPCILVGTQMLAKGHHFPHITLVVVLDADTGLFSPDFRAPERLGQLLTQVAGRAGRGDRPGHVLIQSHHCDHPLLNLLARGQYSEFARHQMTQRQLSGMPPTTHMALIRTEATTARDAEQLLGDTRQSCQQIITASPAMRYLGPFPSPLERRNERYRFQLLIVALERPALHALLSHVSHWLEAEKRTRKVRWSIDVDPQDMS